MNTSTTRKFPIRTITAAAVFMALNIAASSFGVPVPGGHFYLNDVIICTAAILLDPISAFAVGGLGAFLGDLIFYPLPMFVSLVTHGLQAVVISLCTRHLLKEHKMAASIIGVSAGAVIMVVGYSLGRAFIYSTPEYAILKLPYQILQAAIGAILSVIICYKLGLNKLFKNK